jgi:SAM-dependent methyltransferase
LTAPVFGAEYAAAYDQLYQDKDYAAECDLIERLFKTYAGRPVRSVLDLGCGTGNHAVPLAARGFAVVGVDRAPDMLRIARSRTGKSADFELGDVMSVRLNRTFDAVLMMFAVLGYQLADADVEAGLRTARAHLEPGGIFVCDVWYGPAVLAQRPSERVKVIDTARGQLIRVASGDLDVRRDVCHVRYRVWTIADGRILAEAREQHAMRYFFEPELEAMLARSGLELVYLGAFPEIDTAPSEQTWNVALIARAI